MNPRRMIKNFLNEMLTTGLIEVEESESMFLVKFLNEPKKKSSKAATEGFDLEALYKLYPLKKGKAKGMAKLATLIKTKEDYERMEGCIRAYASSVLGREPRYIQHFSTFANGTWQDYVLLPSEAPESTIPESDDYLLILQGVGLHLKFKPHLDLIKQVWPEYENFKEFLVERKAFFNTHSDSNVDVQKFKDTLSKAIKGEIGVRD